MSGPRRDEILETLRRHKAEFADRYGVTSLGVFGSVARDEAGDESDVDIVFETDAPNLFHAARMRLELEELLARHVDVVRLRESMDPRLKKRILREARYA
ncbi:MAG: nucleotidyltransferase family protein [Nitrospinae bacterium]|nr:nucleotidyltransferase family protein [Nitrospinota bacterium]